ncbi:MAG: DNA recombination protein RmuC [Deltaproteobacteria bacterium HGW-Deltaproteobacteria-13]|jgi:DNA recombination protein RmuC|nr:MAG: DNA recombination protein RmuC [Deltaproteobacteria bacterium HGW-Deltaproteobacteria-13]
MEFILIIIVIIVLIGFVLLYWRAGRNGVDLTPLMNKMDTLRDSQERTDRSVRDEIARSRAETQTSSQQERTELAAALKSFGDTVQQSIAQIARMQNDQFESFSRQMSLLTATSEKKMEDIRLVIDEKLKQIQEDNTCQLDRMRETVDEKLQSTLEKRLGESFRQVSERLELVHQGLGDMRNLAAGVGDLKKVLTNVKARGTWGEVQLGALLEEILSPEQYLKNVRISENGSDFVEFAIRLPGQGDSPADSVLIPVDAKFPVEDYHRLLEAQERADAAAADEAVRQLEASIKKAARDISQKYIMPPKTTDFGIMFLPSEGLYAEVIRRTALVAQLQRQFHVVVTGPTTFAAFLNSLQMGFRTLAIQKHSGEIWKVLGEVKTAFSRFGDTLDAVRKKLEQAASSVDDAQKKTRTLSNKLKAVEAAPGETPLVEILPDDKTPAGLNDH